MAQPLIGILAVYSRNEHLFDEFVIPEGLDKDILIDNLCLELAEMSLIYSEPNTLQKMIGIWSKRRNYIWTELYKTLLYKYDPIANYNRIEERVDRNDHIGSHGRTTNFNENFNEDRTENSKDVFKGGVKENWTDGGGGEQHDTQHVDKKTDLEEKTGSQTDHLAYGFNTTVPAKSYTDITTSSINSTQTEVQNGKNDTNNTWNNNGNSGQDTNNTDTIDTTGNTVYKRDNSELEKFREDSTDVFRYKMLARGNIGVTTTQAMIREQREVVQMDLFDIIIKEFKGQFCLMLW